MTQYAIVTDLNRCVGCLACSTACKTVNNVRPADFWIKTLRVGPTPTPGGSGQWPDVEMYFLPVTCQHCAQPSCVDVCPTGASMKIEDGTVQIDEEMCIGCQACISACPYGVRYLNDEKGVVEKCKLCEDRISKGELPQCVAQCGSRARYFGVIEDGVASFQSNAPTHDLATSYDDMMNNNRTTVGEWCEPFEESDVYYLTDAGTGPQMPYILRNRTWQSVETAFGEAINDVSPL